MLLFGYRFSGTPFNSDIRDGKRQLISMQLSYPNHFRNKREEIFFGFVYHRICAQTRVRQ